MKICNWLSTKHRLSVTAAIFSLPFFLSMSGGAMALEPTEEDYALKLLGKYLFFDKISLPKRQSCSSCHTPAAGWTNGTAGTNKKQVAVTGADPHTVGTLKPPTSAYATLIPNFAIVPGPFGDLPFAGNFWNGRATGEAVRDLKVLGEPGDPLHVKYAEYLGAATDQAHASPFINPVEQGLPDIMAVCEHVKSAKYAPLYAIAYEEPINCGAGDVEITFGRFALAIGAFEFSGDVNQFASKRDIALANDVDGNFPLDGFTDQENFGHDLFYGITSDLNPAPSKNAGCGAFCHRNGNNQGTTPQERYTGDGYFNIGTPRNVAIPGNPEPNEGVFFMTENPADLGAHKTPTLRNVDKRPGKGFVKAFMHNGYFKTLKGVVHFYNTSNVNGPTAAAFGVTRCDPGVGLTEEDALANNCWPEPEFTGNIPFFILGSRNLTDEEEDAIVAYMKTFTDPTTKAPKPFNLKKFQNGIPF